jgi:hypothetical protein
LSLLTDQRERIRFRRCSARFGERVVSERVFTRGFCI